MTLRTPLCDLLGISYPIFNVGFARGAVPELAAAVSNAGGCGVIGATNFPAAYLEERVKAVRALTDKPFGANIILAAEETRDETIAACLAAGVPLLVLFWGDPAPYVAEAHRRGTKVFIQVGSVEEAVSAAEAGVDGVIAQGMEAGGHVKSKVALSIIVPSVAREIAPTPVLASGGIADGRGLVAALAWGAQGVSLGTRFVASEEAWAHPEYKARIVHGKAEETVYSEYLFDIGWPGAPHRVLRNKLVDEWEAGGRPPSGKRPGEGSIVGTSTWIDGARRDIVRYSSNMPLPVFEGDLDYASLWCGESVSLVNEIKPAAQIVRDIVREAEEALARL